MKIDIDVPWTTLDGIRTAANVVLEVPENVRSEAPLIILLHGTSGDINDMSDPALHPKLNYERIAPGTIVDRGWHALPNVGFWSVGADQPAPVTGWAPSLAAAGYPTVNYSQIHPRDVLVEPVRELRAVLDAIDTDGRFLPVRDRRIVLMGHSRGGILARMMLVELAASGAPVLARISTCITLHTPNQGSTVANAALAFARLVASWRIAGVPGVPPELRLVAFQALDELLAAIMAEAGAAAYTDFVAGSPTLFRLAAAEPVPGIAYFTFGGTRPVLLNLRGWAFTPESALPQRHAPRFHWSTVYLLLRPLPPPGIVPHPELQEGGDLLTSALLTRLPFGLHRDNHINHAEALWDDGLKRQVLAILNGTPAREAIDMSFLLPLLLHEAPAEAADMACFVPLLDRTMREQETDGEEGAASLR